MSNQLMDKIKECLKEIVEINNINEETDLKTLGMDSMNFIRLVVELEDMFDIEIDEDDIDLGNFQTINSISGLVRSYILSK